MLRRSYIPDTVNPDIPGIQVTFVGRLKMTVRELNKRLREKYPDASNIKHYQGEHADETHLTTSKMPNTNQAGRIVVGWTDELLAMDPERV